MEITEVRVKLIEDSNDRLLGFCSITFDRCFVIRDLKIIEGTNGPFVAMPSRKLTSRCPNCGMKNPMRAAFCNDCGRELPEERPMQDGEGRVKLYADIAHPINSACREMIQARVLKEFDIELQRAEQPGYTSRYDAEFEDAGELPMEELRGEPTEFAAAAGRESPPAGPQTAVVRPNSAPPARSETHVDPSQPMPPPPHPPATQKAPWSSNRRSANDRFGAGIFDDPNR